MSVTDAAALDRSKYEIAHLKLVPKRHVGRMVAAAAVLLVLAAIVRAFSVGQIEWSYVRDFLLAPAILDGLRTLLS